VTFLRMEQVVLTLLRILSREVSLVGDAAIFAAFVHLSGVYMGVVELFNAGVLAVVYSCRSLVTLRSRSALRICGSLLPAFFLR